MKSWDFVIKLPILVLTYIIINIIGNVTKFGPHNGKLRFLGDGLKKKIEDKYYQLLYQTT